jgi:hypothetical protein
MTQVIHSRPGPAMASAHLTGGLLHAAWVLCWGGIIPVWQWAPQPVQPSLEAALDSLRTPALAMAGAVLVVTLLRIAGLRGRLRRLVELGFGLAGIAFAIVALTAVNGLSYFGYGALWQMIGFMVHVGAIVARLILPWVAVIMVIAGLFSLLRPEPRPA